MFYSYLNQRIWGLLIPKIIQAHTTPIQPFQHKGSCVWKGWIGHHFIVPEGKSHYKSTWNPNMLIQEGCQLSQPYQRSLTTAWKLFLQRKKGIAASLDCKGAFDCVGFDATSEALITEGVPRRITLWYTNLLRGRKVTANLQEVTQTITVHNQGSVSKYQQYSQS